MHLYIATRGVKHMRDIFVTTMQSQFFPWKRRNIKTGEEDTVNVQGALRPVELWEYVFPEESLPEVLAMLEIHDRDPGFYSLGAATMKMLRKAIGCKPIPRIPDAKKQNIVSIVGMGIHPIGIKTDERRDFEENGYNQEAL